MTDILQLENKELNVLLNKTILNESEIEAILSCNQESVINDLHKTINYCNRDLIEIEDEISYNLLVYSLFLLKEIQSENQLDIILDVLRWPEEQLEYWLGDFMTEYVWILIYHFGQNDIESIVAFLKEEQVYTFSKEEGALALYQMYLKHESKRNTISQYWTELLEHYNRIPKDNEYIDGAYLAFFTCYIASPNTEQLELVKALYNKEYIDETLNGNFKELYEIIEEERAVPTFQDLNNELEEIESYQLGWERKSNEYKKAEMLEDFKSLMLNENTNDIKIPRNNPCPCGSGKKYKKCCLN